ncbi:MAG: hypothetical protein R2784_07805 [Saprospiraceae bacterium]
MASNGCDSTSYLNLNIRAENQTNLPVSICAGESYQVGNQNFSMGGQYEILLTSSAGCDSTVYLDLLEIDEKIEDLEITLCEGDSIEAGGSFFNQNGDYPINLTAASGCDSLLNLKVEYYSSFHRNDFSIYLRRRSLSGCHSTVFKYRIVYHKYYFQFRL